MKFLLMLLSMIVIAQPGFAAKKVLMMIPDDFMWPEYSIPRKHYEAAGFEIFTAGKHKEALRPDRRNLKDYPESRNLNPDFTFEEVIPGNFDAITFVAGNGAWHDFFPSDIVHKIVREAFLQKKILGLLCASTGLLGFVDNWNGETPTLFTGKKVTGYFRVEGILRKIAQVDFVEGGRKEPGVVVDKNLITGRNPESSDLFGKAIVQALRK